MDFKRKLPIPMEVKARFPLDDGMEEIKRKRDMEIRNIMEGKDERLLLIIGPCSADSEKPVLEYLHRLKDLQKKVEDQIFIVPRLYTGKPRTSGDDYMGMIHQPDPSEKPDMLKGISNVRKLYLQVLRETGFTCADEMLYPDNYRYYNDLLSYVSVGARSVEDQQHRLTASGLNIPVGMKNPLNGDLRVLMNSILAGHHPHDFIYRGWEVHSFGNPLTHGILRGYTDSQGRMHSNYHYEDLLETEKLLREFEIKNPVILLDANHGNSGKDFLKEPEIVMDVMESRKKNPDIRKMVKGFMIESYLLDGAREIGSDEFGKSITDPCLGWEKTEELILNLAKM